MNHQSNEQLDLAFNFLQYTNQNVFLTGKAGTGKTTFLHDLKSRSPKRMVVVAPTGVAAINAGGVTIHSFFQMAFGPQIPRDPDKIDFSASSGGEIRRFNREKINIIRSMDLLVIDEISMVRADLLDAIDEVLRRYKNRYKPFGGVQLLMIGDLQQLAPVVRDEDWTILKNYYDTCYFFSSHALQKSKFIGIELKQIFRQSDHDFIDLLNKVRQNHIDKAAIQELNKRFIPDFQPDEKEGFIILTTHNYQAKSINDSRLRKLKSESFHFKAEVNGDFPEYSFPTDPDLELKAGAQVMFVKNDLSPLKLFFNGKIGKIVNIIGSEIEVQCPGDSGSIKVDKLVWQNCRYNLHEKTLEIEEEVIGTFTQYPLKLAWAITIHKSQGLTFEKAIIDAKDSFAHGQVYVALSRCRTLNGLVLSSRIGEYSIKNDTTVINFTDDVERNQPGLAELELSRKDYIRELLLDLFDFKPILKFVRIMLKLWDEHQSLLMGNLSSVLKEMTAPLQKEMIDVASKFEPQLKALVTSAPDPEENQQLQERIKKASGYFAEKLDIIVSRPFSEISFETDNKAVRKEFKETSDKLLKEAEIKKRCLEQCKNKFTIKSYLEIRSKSAIETTEKERADKKSTYSFLSRYPEFYNRLKQWRQDKADLFDVELRRILPQKSMLEIAEILPAKRDELKNIKGMGGTRMKQFGKEILELVIAYRGEKGMELPVNPSREVKEAGLDSKTTSFFLFSSGKSIEEIASERRMAVGTIESHLTHFIGTGELELEKVIDPEESKTIIDYIEEHLPQSMSEIYNAFEGRYSYSQIRFVQKYVERIKSVDQVC